MSIKSTLALCLLLATTAARAETPAHAIHPEVIGYVFPQNTVLRPNDIEGNRLTRVNYAFANTAGGEMVEGFQHDAENFAVLTSLRKQNPSLKVLVSVGGWLWSGGFSDIALTARSRRRFIVSVSSFLARYDLDGLDIDWEYPGMEGARHVFRKEDKANFTLLLKELRAEFDRNASKRRLLLSIAAGGSNEFLEHTSMGEAQKYLDSVNLMSYDYYEPESDRITGHHAPMFTNPMDPKAISADASVQAFEAAGVPAARIVLGVPFYGHTWGKVADKNHGLFQPGAVIPHTYTPYSVISAEIGKGGFIRYWDPVASAPYLYSTSKQVFITYEDTESLAVKCRYVLQQKLGGVMFWDYSGDPSITLLKAIDDDLANGVTR